MAQFPGKEMPLKQPQGLVKLQHLGSSPLPLILKKTKGVHLYDIDGNKFLDFSLQQGEVVFGHGAEACTKYAKNALSAGLSPAGGHPKDAERAQRLWQRALGGPVSLYNGVAEALCALAGAKKISSFAYSGGYIRQLLSPLQGIIPVKKDGDFRLFEPALGESGDCAVHSRFFYRGHGQPSPLNFLHASPFGGQGCALIFGEALPPPPALSFENAALLAEGAKFKPLGFPEFHHSLAESGNGYALLKKEISLQKAMEAGLIIQGDILFFSPLHSGQDIKRLKRFLDLFI